MAAIHITDIEAAINFWRERKPSPDGVTLAPGQGALSEQVFRIGHIGWFDVFDVALNLVH